MSRLKVVVLLLFLSIGFILFGFLFFGKVHENQRVKTTNMNISDVGAAIGLFEKEFHHYPKVLEELAPPQGNFIYPTARVLDGWEQPIRYYLTEGAIKPFNLYSIGKNGRDEHGSGDDLSFWALENAGLEGRIQK